LNETFKAGTVADTAGFGVKDADGDEIKLGSIGHIGINYTIIYKDNNYVCREAIQSKRKHEETQTQTPTIYDPELFYSPLETLLPESHEEITIEPFLAPERWLVETGAAVLEQANLVESDNPRVSPVALVRCSRGGKTRVSNWMVSHPLQHWNLLPTTVAVLHCWLPGPPCRPITRARLRRAM
jgi:hypothetical protein